MRVEKTIAQVISILFHPLLMPSLGMLILFNSGTYLALSAPEVKKAVLLITCLSTLIFPLTLLPVLYYRNLISDIHLTRREERTLPLLLVLILFILTFVFMRRLPLQSQIHAYALTLPVSVFLLFLFNARFNISMHMVGTGGITGLIISLAILFEVPLQSLFVFSILASGLTGTARRLLSGHSSLELFGGFVLGFIVTCSTMMLY